MKDEKKKENAQKRQEREILKKMKKEKVQQKETENMEKEKSTEPVRKRGRPRKIAEDNPPEESLAEVFSRLRKRRKL